MRNHTSHNIKQQIQLIKSERDKTILILYKNKNKNKKMVKNAKVKRNNDGPGKCTKRGRFIKMVSPEKDYSKKVSSLPVIVCMYVLYID